MNTKTQIDPAQLPPTAADPEVAILTTGNQLILPDSLVAAHPEVTGFEVVDEGARIVLIPIAPGSLKDAWAQIAAQNLTEQDLADAVQWARESSRTPAELHSRLAAAG